MYYNVPFGGNESRKLANNSTSRVLTAAQTFTGNWVDVSCYISVIVAAKSNVDGTLKLQFSTDESTVDYETTYDVTGGVDEPAHRQTINRPYFRVQYVNGSTNQTSFHINTFVGAHQNIVSPYNTALGQDCDAIAVRSFDAETEIVEGLRSGYSITNKFGKNSDIDTATVPEDVWEGGGLYTGFPTGSAELVTVASSDANDASGGTGARTVRIFGLDANYEEQNEDITLDGTNLVDSVNTYTRVNRLKVLTSGSSNQAFNAGVLSVAHKTTTANIFCKVPAGTNQTQIGCFTIPAGKNGYMKDFTVEVDRAITSVVNGSVWYREFGASPRLVRTFTASNTSKYSEKIYGGEPFSEKSDISVRITSCSANNTGVTARFDILLADSM